MNVFCRKLGGGILGKVDGIEEEKPTKLRTNQLYIGEEALSDRSGADGKLRVQGL